MALSEPFDFSAETRKRVNQNTESSFHYKLFSILEQEKYSDVIAWNSTGHSFEIKSAEKLMENVLPQFFSHKKFSSFIRQLSFYGFKSQKDLGGARMYFHPLFQKGNKNLLSNMSRLKRESPRSKNNQPSLPVEETGLSPFEVDEAMQELISANLFIKKLKVENYNLRCQLTKLTKINRNNFRNEYDFSQKNSEELSPLYLPKTHSYLSRSTEASHTYNETAAYERFEKEHMNPKHYGDYLEMESAIPSCEDNELLALQEEGEDSVFSPLEDKRLW